MDCAPNTRIYRYIYIYIYIFIYIICAKHTYCMRYMCTIPPAWILDRSMRGTGSALALSPDGARGGWQGCWELTGPNRVFQVLDLLWRSPESDVLGYKSRRWVAPTLRACGRARRELSPCRRTLLAVAGRGFNSAAYLNTTKITTHRSRLKTFVW